MTTIPIEADTLQDILKRLDTLTNAVMTSKEVLTIEEAAAFTGLSTSTLYKKTSAQEIPHFKPFGKVIYFKRADLLACMLQNRVKTMSEINAEASAHVIGMAS